MDAAGHSNGRGLFVYKSINPDSDNYKKLMHVIQYLRGTQDITLTVEPGDCLNWWVDSSYAVHPDMRSHSGIIMMLGMGAMYSSLCKQKLNTKRSTEAELMGIDDAMDKCCGLVIFWQHKGNMYQQRPYIKTTRAPYY